MYTALVVFALAGAVPEAFAHNRSVSYSSWEIDDRGADVSIRLKLLELSRLGPEALPPGSIPGPSVPGAPDLPARVFPRELVLVADGAPCSPAGPARRRPDDSGWVRYAWRVECVPADAAATPIPLSELQSLAIQSRIMLAVAPSHMHFARVRFSDTADQVREKVLTEAAPFFTLRQAGPAADATEIGGSVGEYVRLGLEHIWTGWDHLAFVFGLMLLATRFGEVARLITGFTAAHSLTLGLAVMNWVHPRAAAVEAVIAFSVALVAIEKGWLESGRGRSIPIAVMGGLGLLGAASLAGWSSFPILTVCGLILFSACYFSMAARSPGVWLRFCLTFAFGLVHGFGFAGVLGEMELPRDRLVPALLGFNVGVEIGQIVVVLVLSILFVVGRRVASKEAAQWATEVATAALCGVGVYWLVERAFTG